jgi:hypothetical protein
MPQSEILTQIRVASPCNAAWDQMDGDERSRFCRACSKHVYNLSEMSRTEAEALVREKEGRLCVRFYRRRDGTVLTDNCPVGLRAMRRALLMQIGFVGSVMAAVPILAPLGRWLKPESPLWEKEPFHTAGLRLGIIKPQRMMIMGAMAAPSQPSPPSPGP